MYIVPLTNTIAPLQEVPAVKEQKPDDGASFKDIFKEALADVQETQRVCEEDNIRVALGEVDDLHTVALNAKKAAIALDVFVAMKNTAVDAYNEIMRINL